jgi:large subunit ribosomal protein L4
MAVIDVLTIKGEKVTQAELADSIFNVPVKNSVLHEAVIAQLASRRSGTASAKKRGEVAGSTKKLYRQKGTGRARRGNIKSPLLRGGGVVFGPKPRSYAYKLPKKVKQLALKMALSTKFKADELLVLDRFDLERIKTKDFIGVIKTLKVENALIVTVEKNEKLEKSSRNVPGIKVMRTEGLNVYDILKYSKLVLLEPSIKGIEGRLLA